MIVDEVTGVRHCHHWWFPGCFVSCQMTITEMYVRVAYRISFIPRKQERVSLVSPKIHQIRPYFIDR
jgi:hypothetical protein